MPDSRPFVQQNRLSAGKSIAYCGLLALLLFGCGKNKDAKNPPKNKPSAAPSATTSQEQKSSSLSKFQPSEEELSRHNRAVALMGQFQFEAARSIFQQLADEQPQWIAARIDLAIATLNRQQPGDSEKAEQILNDVLDHDTTQLRARHCRGILKLHRGDIESAQKDFQYVIDRDPTDAYAAYFSGSCFFKLAQYEKAKAQYASARRIDPYLRSAYYGAMQTAQRLGLKKEVKQLLDDFKKLGTNPQAHLAEIKYTRMGPKAEARAIDSAHLAGHSEVPEGPLFQPAKPLTIESVSKPAWRHQPWQAEESPVPSATVCDLDADGNLDLFLASSLSGVSGQHNAVLFAKVPDSSNEFSESFRLDLDHPLTSVDLVEAALWGDYDNDGLTDVYLCRRGPNQLWRQAPAGHWQDVTEETKTSGADAQTVAGTFFDADHDGDLDLFLVNSQAPNELLSNNLDGTFRPLAESQGIAGNSLSSRGMLALDLDRDRDRDLVVINTDPPHEVFLNDRLWSYHRAKNFQQFCQTPCQAAAAADLDADGQVEILTLSQYNLLHWQPEKSGQWSSKVLAQFPKKNDSPQPTHLELADLDADGHLEAIVSSPGNCWVVSTIDKKKMLFEVDNSSASQWQLATLNPSFGAALLGMHKSEGPVALHPGPGRHSFLVVDFTGHDNQAQQMRSNRSGIGIQGAARVGGHWNAFDSLPNATLPGQSLEPVILGLGGAKQADFLSVLWPDGVFQTELNLSTDKKHLIEETQRQLSSCPVVFAWDGHQFEFVTDILGVGGIGFNLAQGEYSPPRPWENLLLPEGLLRSRNGNLEIKIGEPMEEACYLDSAKLVAYDLPPGWQITLDERLATGAPEPTGKPFFYRQQLIPSRVTNDRREDVTKQISHADLDPALPGKLDHRFIGRTEKHTLELEFDKPLESILSEKNSDSEDHLVLIFHGWLEYPYSQTMFAAWQAGADYSSPTLEARDSNGNWHVLLEQFGYMAGMPRESALPLDSLPTGCDALRLTTNCEIYWDHIKVVAASTCPDAKLYKLPLQAAQLLESGFARRTTRSDRLPHYDYLHRSPLWDTRHMAGFYTTFGNTLPLLDHVDDAVTIFGPGEEVHLQFQALADPPPEGWTRRYVLESYGWCKDMDLYTQDGEQIEPLPLRTDTTIEKNNQTKRQLLHQQFNRRYRDGP